MATQTKLAYGTAHQSVPITCDALADNSTRASTAITAGAFLDILVQGIIAVATTATLTTSPTVGVYAYGTVDGGTTYSGGATGTDADFGAIPQDLDNCPRIGTIACATMDQSYESDVMSIAAAFGGVLPENWGVIIDNQTGQALKSAALFYQGVYATNS